MKPNYFDLFTDKPQSPNKHQKYFWNMCRKKKGTIKHEKN